MRGQASPTQDQLRLKAGGLLTGSKPSLCQSTEDERGRSHSVRTLLYLASCSEDDQILVVQSFVGLPQRETKRMHVADLPLFEVADSKACSDWPLSL